METLVLQEVLVASQCQRRDGPTFHRASLGCSLRVIGQQPTR